jgi:hypothetical protein
MGDATGGAALKQVVLARVQVSRRGDDRQAWLTRREVERLTSGTGWILFKFQDFLSPGKTCKMAKLPFLNSKNYQIICCGRINQREQLSFWTIIQIPNGFWITDSGLNQYLKFVWIFKRTKPFGKNSNNSPKLSLCMIFKNINLNGITCVKKFEDPSQVINWA